MKIEPTFKRLRLLDEDGSMSLTSLCLFVVLGKLAVAPSVDVYTLAALLLALLNINAKRFSRYKKLQHEDRKVDALSGEKERITKLESEIKGLATTVGFRQIGR